MTLNKIITVILCLLGSVFANAIEVSDVAANFSVKTIESKTKGLVQSLNFGLANTTGNVQTLNANGKYTLALSTQGYNEQDLEISFDTSFLITENEGIRDNEEYTINLGVKQFIIDEWLGYISTTWLRNTFRNFDNKLLLGAGAGKEIFQDEKQTLTLKLGIAYNIEQYTNDQLEHEFTSLTQYIKYNNQINKVSLLYARIGASENIEDFDDYEVLSVVGFNFAVGEKISVTIEGEFRYDNIPPEGFERVDTKSIVRVGYNF